MGLAILWIDQGHLDRPQPTSGQDAALIAVPFGTFGMCVAVTNLPDGKG